MLWNVSVNLEKREIEMVTVATAGKELMLAGGDGESRTPPDKLGPGAPPEERAVLDATGGGN